MKTLLITILIGVGMLTGVEVGRRLERRKLVVVEAEMARIRKSCATYGWAEVKL